MRLHRTSNAVEEGVVGQRRIGVPRLNGAAQESNLPSRGLHDRTGFEGLSGKAAPLSYAALTRLGSAQVMWGQVRWAEIWAEVRSRQKAERSTSCSQQYDDRCAETAGLGRLGDDRTRLLRTEGWSCGRSPSPEIACAAAVIVSSSGASPMLTMS